MPPPLHLLFLFHTLLSFQETSLLKYFLSLQCPLYLSVRLPQQHPVMQFLQHCVINDFPFHHVHKIPEHSIITNFWETLKNFLIYKRSFNNCILDNSHCKYMNALWIISICIFWSSLLGFNESRPRIHQIRQSPPETMPYLTTTFIELKALLTLSSPSLQHTCVSNLKHTYSIWTFIQLLIQFFLFKFSSSDVYLPRYFLNTMFTLSFVFFSFEKHDIIFDDNDLSYLIHKLEHLKDLDSTPLP